MYYNIKLEIEIRYLILITYCDIITFHKGSIIMIKSGIAFAQDIIEIKNDEILTYLNKLIEKSTVDSKQLEIFKQRQLFWDESNIIKYFVQVLGYTIIYDNIIYFQSEIQNKFIDKIDYIKNGYKLEKLPKLIYKSEKFIEYKTPAQQQIEKEGFKHSMSLENNLSFWYPKTTKIGFKTPNTIITDFSDDEVKLIKTIKWQSLDEEKILQRIKNNASNREIDLNEKMFIRLGNSSNKFNFNTCHIKDINELYKKLMIMFEDMYFELEWEQNIELVLREYIKTNYQRNTIYNGMPLNTEFRVFYDFDENKILEIFNYWEKDTMLDNLHNQKDLITFANTTHEIESDFARLYPFLKEEVEFKLPSADLKGKWSVDFMYDGKEFVLIDMAHAECSYYYDKVLNKQKILK